MMKHAARCSLFAGVVWVVGLQAQATPTSVTLFNSGRVLVRRTLPLALPAGVSTHALALGAFTATTFETLDAGVSLVRLNADANWSENSLLRRNIGKTFFFDSIGMPRRRAVLLSLDPERWEWVDLAGTGNGVVFGRPGKITWPKELIPAARVADVTLESDRARSGVNVMYETDGAGWSASYRALLGGAGRFEGLATISAGTLELADAEVQLLAGNIGRQLGAGGGRGGAMNVEGGFAMRAAAAPPPPSQESIGDAHLYTMPGRLTFISGAQTIAPIMDPVSIKGERRFTVPGIVPFYGGFNQNEDEQVVPVSVAYRFNRRLGTPFGDMPLPAGSISLYDTDKSGRVQLIGLGYIDHSAPGQEILVESGTAFDVTARRVQLDFSSIQGGKPLKTTQVAGYRVTLNNAKDTAIVVDVREDHSGTWSIVESSLPAVKKSSTRVVFSVPVAARDSAVLTYRVRVIW